MRKILFISFLLYRIVAFAQPVFERLDTIKVSNFGTPLKNPWTGGLNFTEWSAIDLDLDGIKDLAVFDKTGDKIRTFKNNNIVGTASYKHAPEFQSAIPSYVNSWAVFYDYNNDGKEDLFTYALGFGGIRVYKNTSTVGNPQFTFFKNYLISDYDTGPGLDLANTPVSSVALPGLADIDNDGDMDVLTFQSSGIQFEFHKNMSMERYGVIDSLVFDVVDRCWGDAVENNCSSTLSYPSCPLMQLYNETVATKRDAKVNAVMHSGSCLLCLDMDGDNDKDLVVSDVSCDSIEYFRNAGSLANAHFDYTTKLYPNGTNPITFKQFPCTYFLDLDNDNKRDLIAAPNIQASENYKGVWFYKNNGADNAPNFQLIKKTFLQDEMLDFGEGSYPTTLDYDADGDMDLLVGNFGYYAPVSVYNCKVALLENTGTSSAPRFNLVNSDYAGLSSGGLRNMAPATGDMDGDGDKDLLIGDSNGKLSYYTNTAPIGTAANFVLAADYTTGFLAGIDVGNNAYPQIIDVDRDGLKDVLVGEYDGTINYFKNIGTITVPVLAGGIGNWGSVKVNKPGYFEAQSTPCLFDDNGSYKLMIGSERGYLYMYGNIDGNLSGTFTLIDSTYNDIYEGEQMAPHLFDFTNDGKLDLIVGNYSGGLAYFKGAANPNAMEENMDVYMEMVLYPNPATHELSLQFNNYNNAIKIITLYDAIGRKISENKTGEQEYTLNLDQLQTGLYIVEVAMIFPDNKMLRVSKRFIRQ
ncbi:MAG: T9SS type A sorting domain-containing protein [Bacteroidota bacterium]|nr:T9SS type A sorting domain-containing protein [Bacteroidota bacterium]